MYMEDDRSVDQSQTSLVLDNLLGYEDPEIQWVEGHKISHRDHGVGKHL